MNKKLLTLAVAAAIAAPAATMADATVYGVAQLSLDSWDMSSSAHSGAIKPNGSLLGGASWEGFDGLNVGDAYHSNRFGIKGSEDLGNGLKAIFKMEFAVTMADTDSKFDSEGGNVKSNRNMYVGLSGDWGTALIGRHDTPVKTSTGRLDMFADTVADYNFGNNIRDIRADNIIMYVSPNWNGLTVSGALVAPGAHCSKNVTGSCSSDGASIDHDLDGFEGYSIAAMYSNGPWYASVGYETFDEDAYGESSATVLIQDDELWRVGFGYTINAFKIGAVYENWELGQRSGAEIDSWQISGSYTFGNNVVKAMYGQSNLDVPSASFGSWSTDEDTDTWAIGIDHNFSKRTKAYLIYTEWENDDTSDADYDVFSLGMRHTF